jgi:hypothetical protein
MSSGEFDTSIPAHDWDVGQLATGVPKIEVFEIALFFYTAELAWSHLTLITRQLPPIAG